MKHFIQILVIVLSVTVSSCGLKLVNPEDEKNKGTMAVDWSTGKIVATYTCKLVGAGKTFRAIGKSEDEASKEVVAKCRDSALITICIPENVKCTKN